MSHKSESCKEEGKEKKEHLGEEKGEEGGGAYLSSAVRQGTGPVPVPVREHPAYVNSPYNNVNKGWRKERRIKMKPVG